MNTDAEIDAMLARLGASDFALLAGHVHRGD